jgi:hypothetical protein
MTKDTPGGVSYFYCSMIGALYVPLAYDDEELELVGPPSSCSKGEMARKSARVEEREPRALAGHDGPQPSARTSTV